jgi:DNA-binding NarL/FixJ family response regulator
LGRTRQTTRIGGLLGPNSWSADDVATSSGPCLTDTLPLAVRCFNDLTSGHRGRIGPAALTPPHAPARPGNVPGTGVSVVVLDTLPLYRKGVTSVLTTAGFVVEELSAWDEAIPEAVHVVVAVMRASVSWAQLQSLRADAELVTIVSDARLAPHAIRAGASAILLEDAAPHTLIHAISAAEAGLTVVPRQAACLLGRCSTPSEGDVVGSDERGWLLALSQGATVAELARGAAYSEREMHRRLARTYQRMGVKRRTEAITLAERWGLLDAALVSSLSSDGVLSRS